MKRLLILYILLSPFIGVAKTGDTLFLTRDSLSYYHRMNVKWLFRAGDDPGMAMPGYPDSEWQQVNPGLWADDPKKYPDSIYWFRLHFIADTSVVASQLTLQLSHFGASEVYLDGKLTEKFGRINAKEYEYYDPCYVPILLHIDTAGPHLLAIRYKKNMRISYARSFSNLNGFSYSLASANQAIADSVQQAMGVSFILILLFGIFLALSLVHLMLYLYYKAARSNLFFSIFCFALSLAFFFPFLIRFARDPATGFAARVLLLCAAALACFSLSGFINELFGKRKIRFWIITAFCIIMPFIWFIERGPGTLVLFSLIGLVSLEAVILTIRGIIRKVKGARIIGTGILIFTLFILFMFGIVLTIGDIDIDESTTFGQVVEFFMAIAILSIPGSMSAYLAWSFSSVSKDLKKQLEQVQVLSVKTLEQEQEKQRILENQKEDLEKEVKMRTAEVVQQHEALKTEKKKSDDLLLNILPGEVAEELKEKGSSEAKYFDQVSVLFTDFVAFTKAGERMTPQELVSELHTCFKAFDEIISKYGIEKIKTIGDAYLAVSGLPIADEMHAEKIVDAALEILQFMKTRKQQVGDKTFEIRIGIHSGSVVAGIVGVKKFAYDIWGDTVNTAARMEQNSESGKVNISQSTYELVSDKFDCTFRGQVTAKNKGALNMFFVEKRSNQQ